MRRLLSLLCILATLLSLISCAWQPEERGTEPVTQVTENESVTGQVTQTPEETETIVPEYDEKVSDYLSQERLAQIPIAHDGMTSDQLRQICVDYVCLSVSFQWLPSESFSYVTSSVDLNVIFNKGKLYGGIPYVNLASGNLYRMMEYYDTETGVLNVEGFVSNKDLFGTACSGTACWGWARVINSATMKWTSGMNTANGFIPVGSYTYDASIEVFGKNGAEDCKPITRRNGKQVMFESYAQALKADCLVNNGHVRMLKENPVVVRDADGTINGEESHVIQCEQGLYTVSEIHDRISADGTKYKIQGNDNLKTSFAELYEAGYLPHTFAEFLGTDPVEPGSVKIEHSSPTATLHDLQKGNLVANYPISDVFTVVKDAQGTEVFRYAYRSQYHFTKAFAMAKVIPSNAVRTFQEGGNHTIEILVQLSTGELVTAYRGTLVA